MLGDMVIGIITGKLGESFKVDIGSYLPAQLSFYAFEGATKKNKPDLKVSALAMCVCVVGFFFVWQIYYIPMVQRCNYQIIENVA